MHGADRFSHDVRVEEFLFLGPQLGRNLQRLLANVTLKATAKTAKTLCLSHIRVAKLCTAHFEVDTRAHFNKLYARHLRPRLLHRNKIMTKTNINN